MKIAMIGHKRIPSREGGIEIVVEELASRMASQGHNVVIYNRGGSSYGAESSGYNPRTKRYKGMRLVNVPIGPIKNADTIIYSFAATVRALFCGYDVIHYHAEGPCVMLPIARFFRIRAVATIHGLDWQRGKWGKFASMYIHLGEKMAAKYASELIVLSANVQQYFMDTYKRESIFLPNGITPVPEIGNAALIREKFGLEPESYILITSRLVPEKGIHYAIEAFKAVKTDKKLLIAGDISISTPYINNLKELASGDARIIFSGFISGQTLEELYQNCFLFLLPSDLEGMSMSFLEALGRGRRCLTSNIPENTEVGGVDVAYFEKSNVKSLKKAIEDILDGRRTFLSKDELAEKYQSKYSWDGITRRTLEIYGKNPTKSGLSKG